MPVSSQVAEYEEYLPLWTQVRECVKGEHAIKAARTKYLPRPTGQTDDEYDRYMERVHFSDFTSRTADGLHGNIFSKPPVHTGETPEVFKDFLDNVDLSGSSINQFASDLCQDLIKTNFGGILVDHATVPEGMSVGDVQNYKLTSFMRGYAAENVINWRYETVMCKEVLALVVLRESYFEFGADKFVPDEKIRYRVLELINGVYTQQLYELVKNAATQKEEYLPVGDPFPPQLEGKPLDFIPFYPCPGKRPEKSMLLGLSYENIGHYQKTADYEQDIHYTAIHTPIVTGMKAPVDQKTKKPISIPVGGSRFIFLEGEGDKVPNAKYLETGGSENILKAINACEERMAILGARIISVEKKGVETAEAARIHRAGENSVLGAFAMNMSEQLTLAARLGARWRGVPETITEKWSIDLNVDYEGDSTQVDEKRVGMLEVEAGLMSNERYWKTFDGMTDEEIAAEKKKIEGDKEEEEPPPQPQQPFQQPAPGAENPQQAQVPGVNNQNANEQAT